MYVDAIWNKKSDQIQVVERVNGKRVFQTYPAKFVAYYEHDSGEYTTVYGTRAARIVRNNYRKFKEEVLSLGDRRLFESDINPIFRCLSEHYLNADPPNLNVAFFDIEVASDPDKGFAPPTDPFNAVTAIGVHLSNNNETYVLGLRPHTYTESEAKNIAKNLMKKHDNTYVVIFETERELLEAFLTLIEDADILTGWNSTLYDIPYLINRIQMIISKEAIKDFCLWDQYPKERIFERFKREQKTYDLVGRIHLDYLELYQAYTYVELHTYKLDYVGEYEVNEKKVPYEGSLQQLYENDFDKFLDYNRQDVMIMVKIDQSKKFIQLANSESHMTTVRLPDVLGSVRKIEQAIINEAHRRGMVVPNKKINDNVDIDEYDEEPEEERAVAGAYVANPKIGMHEYIGAVDINSLYPSAIRSLNMAPEKLFAQVEPTLTRKWIRERLESGVKKSDVWIGQFATLEYEEIMNKTDTLLEITINDEETHVLKAKDIYSLVFDSDLVLTANGTIFKTDTVGIIPGLLGQWYADRKEMQKKAEKAKDDGDMKEYEYWDMRQLIQKILLNSTYGALLNKFCRFYDDRIGQSVTLTGRCITRHMISQTNKEFTGEYDINGEAIIYGDTDSSYFSSLPLHQKKRPDVNDWFTDEWKQYFIDEYDEVAEKVNKTFADQLKKDFNVDPENCVIKAGREIVGLRGLFVKKKKYAILVYDKEGDRKDLEIDKKTKEVKGYKYKDGKRVYGSLKVMGLDLKRSDTPIPIQRFLENVLNGLLEGQTKDEVFDNISSYRKEFKLMDSWEKGSPKKINGMLNYSEKEKRSKDTDEIVKLKKEILQVRDKRKAEKLKKQLKEIQKVNLPGHVRAALNWNKLCDWNSDKLSTKIQDGDKINVCKLKKNPNGITSIALPVDEEHIPEWFKKLPFDDEEMEKVLIDKKLSNFLGVLNWDLSETRHDNDFTSLFESA